MAPRVTTVLLTAVTVGSLAACTSGESSPEQPTLMADSHSATTPPTTGGGTEPLPPKLKKRLRPAGYEVEEAVNEHARVSAKKAVSLARAFGSPRDIDAVYLAWVTTPKLGEQTAGGFMPTFDDRLMWLVTATARAEVGGTAAYVPPEQSRNEATSIIEKTAVTFVDASTGAVERATSL